MKIKGNYVLLSLVCLVLGFMVAYSYSFTSKKLKVTQTPNAQWDREYELRSMLIEQEQTNSKLENQVARLQEKARAEEQKFADQESKLKGVVKEVGQLRMYLGAVKVKGEGVEVTLSDAANIPADKNVNNYLVHDGHIQALLNELRAAGASALAVNGQRLSDNSYVTCIGPVINVDGTEHPAPFVITAIGDPAVLDGALHIPGGIMDQFARDNIGAKAVTKNDIVLEPSYKK
ncbi:DUF881 domain-containing protein [Bacillus sp. 165]|uniref:DUF881 domain-containing protein n=1 Tax=Bacillus sp. 165 TaxID=1529117 RepID=UPI001ADBED99|nr:DUF881 domain-containing protein [Bacillus sp. 165]MBO9130261.1 DUF881 domain-containing protein [Bacillus sp. 165]